MTPRRGMMLVEMLVLIILTSACILIASRLTTASYLQLHELPAIERSMAGSDNLLATLRSDAWGASKFDPLPRGVRLTSGGRTIDWTVDDAGTVTRQAGEPRSWREIAPGLAFQPQAAVLVIRWPAGRDVSEIRLASQVLLAGGGR
jgi:hypothetical protein